MFREDCSGSRMFCVKNANVKYVECECPEWKMAVCKSCKSFIFLHHLSRAETDVKSYLLPCHTIGNLCHPPGHALSSLPVVEGYRKVNTVEKLLDS